ncbi:beta-lactamase/transpeptidase-like protein [Panaeolus papilionaceus]|nr:beta-lactamase/transpeptidase-like protein [Panaeolus papilionaceus]
MHQSAEQIFDDILNQAVDEGGIPAVVFTFGNAEEVLYSGCAGRRTVNNPASDPVNGDSVFWICSQTKLITTIALLQIIEKGIVGYETPVEDVIPELKNPIIVENTFPPPSSYRPATKIIKMKHLLNHTSGLAFRAGTQVTPGGLYPPYTSSSYEGNHSVDKFLNSYGLFKHGYPAVPLAFEPGDNWGYGFSCDISAIVVERLTGRSIEDYCKEYIFGPLGMGTSFYLTPSKKSKLVHLAIRQPDSSLRKWEGSLGIPEQDPLKMGICLGGIGTYSIMKSYFLFLQHLLRIRVGLSCKNPIISQETLAIVFEPSISAQSTKAVDEYTPWGPNLQFGHGLCLNTTDWEGRRKSGSGFWFGWAGTYYLIDPTTGVTALLGTQVLHPHDAKVHGLWERLERAMYSAVTQELVK